MRCPFCISSETQVKDSRISDDGEAVKRRRYCPACDSRFTTYERVQLREMLVIKKNGEKRIFDPEKLKKSIEMAVRKRPISDILVDKMVNKIIRQLEMENETEIPSAKIGEMVMEALGKLDQVAFLRFASVYKNFSEPEDFQKFIKQAISNNKTS